MLPTNDFKERQFSLTEPKTCGVKFKPELRNGWSTFQMLDAIVVMYSILDRGSFHLAREILDWLAVEDDSLISSRVQDSSFKPFVTCPVYVLANKNDLCHLRQVRKNLSDTIALLVPGTMIAIGLLDLKTK